MIRYKNKTNVIIGVQVKHHAVHMETIDLARYDNKYFKSWK